MHCYVSRGRELQAVGFECLLEVFTLNVDSSNGLETVTLIGLWVRYCPAMAE